MQQIKNNVGDIAFEGDTPDRYPKPIRVLIYFFVGIFAAPIAIFMACKRIGEKERIK